MVPQLQQEDTSTSLVWSFLLPLAFYALWQLVYFLIVQVSASAKPNANSHFRCCMDCTKYCRGPA